MDHEAWRYPFDIESVANIHGHSGFPANLVQVHARKQAGDPFDPTAAANAEDAARFLANISSECHTSEAELSLTLLTPDSDEAQVQNHNITPAVVNTATNRASLLRQLGKILLKSLTTGVYNNN